MKSVWCALIRRNLGLCRFNLSTRITRFSFVLTGHSNLLEHGTKVQLLATLVVLPFANCNFSNISQIIGSGELSCS